MRRTTWALTFACFLISVVPAEAASVGLNFRRGSGEQNMAPTESAGVAPQVNWNNADGMASGTSALNISGPTANAIVDDIGAVVPGLSIEWTSNGTWSAPNSAPGDLNLMSGYLDDTGTAGDTVITVTGVPYANYDVYAFVGSDGNDRSGRVRILDFFANDRWFRTNSSPFAGFVEATATTQPASTMGLANYVHYRSMDADNFVLRAIRGSNNVGVHGIQIVETDGSAAPNWLAPPTAAPADPAPLLSAINSIGLNFVGGRANTAEPDGHAEDDGIVTGMAGVPSVAQSNWNDLFGIMGSDDSLTDRNGSALAGTNVTWSANNLWTITDVDPLRPDDALMKGYLDTTDVSTTTVTISDLPSQWAEYDVYVYIDGDATAGRAGNYTIDSPNDGSDTASVSDTANWPFVLTADGIYTRANENADDLSTNPGMTSGNYLVFSGRSDLSFTLTSQGSLAGASPARAPINAIQIVATRLVPEPSSMALVGLGTLIAGAVRRRRTT